MSTPNCPKCGQDPCTCKPREISGKWFVGIFLAAAVLLSAAVLGLFYFHFFDILKEYRKNVPPLPRATDRG